MGNNMNQNQQQAAQKIRARYTPKEVTDLDQLRQLDIKVRRPATVFAYIFGSISAIIMGCGMSLVMTDIADMLGLSVNSLPLGITIGGIGMILALINYPIYRAIVNARKKRYGAEILDLSDKIMKEEN